MGRGTVWAYDAIAAAHVAAVRAPTPDWQPDRYALGKGAARRLEVRWHPILTRAIVASHGLCSGCDAARYAIAAAHVAAVRAPTPPDCTARQRRPGLARVRRPATDPPRSDGPTLSRAGSGATVVPSCGLWSGQAATRHGAQRSYSGTVSPLDEVRDAETTFGRSGPHSSNTKTGPHVLSFHRCFHFSYLFSFFPICFHETCTRVPRPEQLDQVRPNLIAF